MSKRRTHSPEFKFRVAMEAISGRKVIQEIAADRSIRLILVIRKFVRINCCFNLFTPC
jgi:hypothetical protein